MPLCKLCKEREANKTGSHILSWFLIADAVNNTGKRGRHNEVAFEISTADFVSTYFGSQVLPPDIEKVKGRELTDEEIDELAKQKNPYTEDYIVCSHCEDRLGTMESFISRTVFGKLRAYQADPSARYEVLEFSQKEAVRLFIYSLAWRASVTKFNHFSMDSFYEEMLRRILHASLDLEEAAFSQKAKDNSKKICELPLIVSFLETKGENTNSIYCLKSTRPYAMIINDLAFQLFFKEKHTKTIDETVFGINRLLPKQQAINLNEEKIRIAVINDTNRKIITGKLADLIADKILHSALSMFRYAFSDIFQMPCPSGLANYYKFVAAISTVDKIQRYSPQHFRNVAADVMKQHYIANQFAILRRLGLR